MKLIHCDMCGIVINADATYLHWTDGWDDEKQDYVDPADDLKEFIPCPMCDEKIVRD